MDSSKNEYRCPNRERQSGYRHEEIEQIPRQRGGKFAQDECAGAIVARVRPWHVRCNANIEKNQRDCHAHAGEKANRGNTVRQRHETGNQGKKSSADAEFPALAEWTAIQLNIEGTAQPVRQRIEQTRRMRQIDVHHLPTSLM